MRSDAWIRSDPWAAGGTLAVAVALTVGAVSALVGDHAGATTLWVVLALGAAGLAAAVRASAYAVAVAALLAALEIRDPAPWGTWAVAGGLLFLFALRRPRFDAIAAGAVVAGGTILARYTPYTQWQDSGSVGTFGLVTLVAAVVGVGQWVQAQRRYVIAEVGRRRQEAERRREEVARHVAEERLRIARELHDSVAHHLAVVSVHTNVAKAHLDPSQQASRRALDEVQAATRSVLEELGVVLGVLRASESEIAPAAPVDAAMVDELLESFEGIGLKVETEGLDQLLALAPVARTAGRRLLQEALTNAQRYGDGGATVTVDPPAGGYLTLSVRNPWTPRETESAGSGLGLVGMEERVHALGGTFHAGPDPEGFLVTAQLPAAAPRRTTKETSG
ncbi:sensor histidine kinase [Streptomyces sp. SD11]|uniref:sensor histidine kinase n=1 Tax=unclassified Streptomyces TaxID=2593676 RepID=UPI00200E49CE|nr:histidine kinase [Streptomyces sp. LRE541]UPZ29141.1 histidine kinase [Streptomyces sp. LRE541]